jgi:hypothetical protein
MGSRDSSVRIATGYGLEGPGLIPKSARFFSSPQLRPSMGPTQLSNQWVPATLSPGGKAAGACI